MKTTQLALFVSVLGIPVLFSGAANAQDVPPNSPAGIFGDEGQVAISSDAGLSISNTSVDGIDGSTTEVVLRPAIDYFAVDHLSIGGFVGVNHVSAGDFSTTSFSIGPRIGYDFALSRRVSLWPKLGVSFANTSVDVDDDSDFPGDDDAGDSNTAAQLNLFLPFLFHPVDHFFIGFGPALDQDLSGDAKATTIAARLTLGGWM